jgi:large subunit ribosomal protein L21
VVSGGKQYRVAAGDRILVDRVAAEPGAELTLDRVLMVAEGDTVKVGAEALAAVTVTARVVEHRRGPKIDVLRYKAKKRVRVHRGARADLTALEILSVGTAPQPKPARKPVAKKAAAKTAAKPASTEAESASSEETE